MTDDRTLSAESMLHLWADGDPRPAVRGRERWRELHARAARPVIDAVAEVAWIDRLADGLEGCGCVEHWQAYLHQHPPTIGTTDDYTTWAAAAHDAVNRRLGKPAFTPTAAEAGGGSTVR